MVVEVLGGKPGVAQDGPVLGGGCLVVVTRGQ